MNKIVLSLAALCLALTAGAQSKIKGFQIVEKPGDKEVAILYNGRLLTAYTYYDSWHTGYQGISLPVGAWRTYRPPASHRHLV
jgi:hypothetical protein